MAHLYIYATHKSSGKTTLSIGLAAALRSAGEKVQTFKKGPDYIDPSWLKLASSRPCINLDFYTNSMEENFQLFDYYMQSATIGLIEGNKGLYDGMDINGKDCNAALAKALKSPVILVINTQGTIRGVAPLLLGYQQFDPEVNIQGVILNNVGGSRHESKLCSVLEEYTDIKVIGAIHKSNLRSMSERHLGLITADENQDARLLVQKLADSVRDSIDLHSITQIANTTDYLPQQQTLSYPSDHHFTSLKIGIFKSSAFGFYYDQDIEVFKRSGCQLIPVNPLSDASLPDIDALFIGGGFPETHLQPLASNIHFRKKVKDAITAGLPCYAECGGLMYLTRSIRWKEQKEAMCDVIPADTIMHNHPQGRGYIHLRSMKNHPWGLAENTLIKAHEFHFSSF